MSTLRRWTLIGGMWTLTLRMGTGNDLGCGNTFRMYSSSARCYAVSDKVPVVSSESGDHACGDAGSLLSAILSTNAITIWPALGFRLSSTLLILSFFDSSMTNKTIADSP